MKIGFDAHELCVGHAGGLRSYVESVLTSLGRSGIKDSLVVYADGLASSIAGVPDDKTAVCSPRNLLLREQFAISGCLRAHGVDIAHFPANTAPLRCPVPFVLTLHDTFCIERPVKSIVRSGNLRNKVLSLYSKYVPMLCAKRAAKIVTVSRYSAERIAQTLELDQERIAVIPQALQDRYRRVEAEELRADLLSALGVRKLVLVLGSAEPRKNLARTLLAFEQLQARRRDIGLVMTVPDSASFWLWMEQPGHSLPELTRQMTGVSDDDLVRLYCAVDALVFVSEEEGFGLPVVEAMACGCPVLTSNTSCLPDTAGGAALLADPYDIDSIVSGIEQLVDVPQLADSLIEAGYRRAQELSHARVAADLVEVYRNALAQTARGASRSSLEHGNE